MTKTGDEICKEVTQLHSAIACVSIIEHSLLRAIYVKTGATANVPKPNRLETMGSQAEIILGVLKTNEETFGKVHYLMSHGDKADMFFFPVWLNGRRMSLAVQVMPPYIHEELIERLRRYIGETMAGTSSAPSGSGIR